jgi:DNA-binding LacI/PurR family transcriptional regulator
MRGERPGRPTLIDVAEASHVSRQTVSNALNYPQRVAPETLERVLAEISRLGFQPNRAARSLRRQRANAIGLQVEPARARGFGNLLDPFLAALTASTQAADAHLITFVADNAEVLATYEHLLDTQVVDGFVLTHTRHDDPRAGWLRDRGVPFVSFGRIWDEPGITSWVDVDGRAGTVAAVQHVRDQGYRQVAFLGWPAGSPVGDDRRAGWQAATDPASGDDPALTATTEQDVLAAEAVAQRLLDRLEPGDAVVCVSDVVALGVHLALGRRGLRPGTDIGIVGFDDVDLADVFGLTTVRQPLGDIATELVRMIERPVAPTEGVVVSPVVVARGSTAR